MSHRTALPARISALTDDDAAIATFLARYSGSTRPTYESAIRRFVAWCTDSGVTPLSATRAQLEMFSHWLADEQHLKPSTIAGYLSVLGSFYRIAVADSYIERDPMIFVRKPKVIYDEARTLGLDRMQLGKLIQHARSTCPKRAALVSLMGLLGLRVSEACSVRIEDFQDVERGHRVLRMVGKGGKPATIPLPPPVARALDACAAERTSGYLLTTSTGKRLTRHDAFRWIRTLARQCGLPAGVHPHTLRHAAITAALDAGAPLRDAQVFARHSDPRVTTRYDRGRLNLDRHPSYLVSSFVAGAA